MKKLLRSLAFVLGGAGYAALGILLSRGLIRSLDVLAGWFGSSAGLDAEITAHAVLVLAQLREAQLTSPWLLLCVGMLPGLLFSFRKRWTAAALTLHALVCSALLIFLTAASLLLTDVNGIRAGALLHVLLPMLPAIL